MQTTHAWQTGFGMAARQMSHQSLLNAKFDPIPAHPPTFPPRPVRGGKLELVRLRQKGFDLSVSEEAFEFLLRHGIHKNLGARPMKRTVQKFLSDAVREAIKSSVAPTGRIEVSPCTDTLAILL